MSARIWTRRSRRARLGLALLGLLGVLSVVAATHNPFGGAAARGNGYLMVGSDGGTFAFGGASFDGSAADIPLRAPIVGMAATTDGGGYWLVGSDGGVFTYGDAGFHGSAAGVAKNAPIVGIAANPAGPGYWLVGADGGVYSGDAGFYGPAALVPLKAPIVGIAASPDGRGYWLIGADGGVFSFGDAGFFGSASGVHLHAPIVGMAATPDGRGYWLVGADGGVFTYGDARFFGSVRGPVNRPVVGIAPTPDGGGYWIAAADGGVFTYGDAPFQGSAGNMGLRAGIVGIVPTSTASSSSGGGNFFCGSRSGPPTTSKLLVIWEENASASSVYGNAAAPHMNTYAQACGHATNYTSLGHPSLPNYLEATSGVSYNSSPWTSDCEASSSGCTTPNENIFDQVGGNWKGYAQSMPTVCDRSNSGPYLSRHNPAVYYTDLGLACLANDVNIGTPAAGPLQSDIVNGTLPTFATLTPDVNNDQHNGTLQQADSYLASWINEIVSGPDYQSGRLTVAIVYDEGSGSGSTSVVAAIFMSPFIAPGTTSNLMFTHYSLLAAAEDVAGVPRLGNAATAANLRTAFGF